MMVKFFLSFLDKQFHKWYFGLNTLQKTDWNLFKNDFIVEAERLKFYYYQVAFLPKSKFTKTVEAIIDDKTKEKFNKKPIKYLIKLKFYYLSLVFPGLKEENLVDSTINSIDDYQLRNEFFEFRNCSILQVLNNAKSLDMSGNYKTTSFCQ